MVKQSAADARSETRDISIIAGIFSLPEKKSNTWTLDIGFTNDWRSKCRRLLTINKHLLMLFWGTRGLLVQRVQILIIICSNWYLIVYC